MIVEAVWNEDCKCVEILFLMKNWERDPISFLHMDSYSKRVFGLEFKDNSVLSHRGKFSSLEGWLDNLKGDTPEVSVYHVSKQGGCASVMFDWDDPCRAEVIRIPMGKWAVTLGSHWYEPFDKLLEAERFALRLIRPLGSNNVFFLDCEEDRKAITLLENPHENKVIPLVENPNKGFALSKAVGVHCVPLKGFEGWYSVYVTSNEETGEWDLYAQIANKQSLTECLNKALEAGMSYPQILFVEGLSVKYLQRRAQEIKDLILQEILR